MTHVSIDYSAHESETQKQTAALTDIISYLGQEKFTYLTNEFQKFQPEDMTVDHMSGYLMLAGISGYPVTAWHSHIQSIRQARIESDWCKITA